MAYRSAICTRCGGERWPDAVPEGPYTCQRCRAVLAGRPADDPLGSPAQQAARKAAGERGRQRFARGKFPSGPGGAPS